MKLIIDVSEEDYKECKFRKDLLSLGGEPTELTFNMRMKKNIGNGTPLPKGHGRLIDADKINFDSNYFYNGDDTIIAEETINDCPTVIESDKENKE